MSVYLLQEKIRKLKNPSVVDFNMLPEHIPPHIQERDTFFVNAYEYCCGALLEGLKEIVPAVRFSMNAMALYGADGLIALSNLTRKAKELGYYVFLDCPGAYCPRDAGRMAQQLFSENGPRLSFDGLIVSSYIGSDGIRPICDVLRETMKDLFVLVRSANKSAPEMQDLLTGSRLMYLATADVLSRFAQPLEDRSGYSQVAAVAAATSADSLRTLRQKHQNLFLLVDGYDYSGANAKNCSFAFDPLGHGAAACAGTSVTAAWQETAADEKAFVQCAVEAAERMRKNLTRYVTVL